MVDEPSSAAAGDDAERRAFFEDLRSSGWLDRIYDEFRARRAKAPPEGLSSEVVGSGAAANAGLELRLSAVETRVGQVDTRLAVVETKLENLGTQMEKLEARIDSRLDSVDASLKEVREQARMDFRLLFGALITLALGVASLMAKGFHWL